MKKASARPPERSRAPEGSTLPESVLASLGEETRWARRAEEAITRLAARGSPFTSNDLVHAVGAPPSASLLPALVRAAHRRGLIARDRTAPLGTVWVGASPDSRPKRAGLGRRVVDRRDTPVGEDLWRAVLERAAREKVGTDEVLARALRSYLTSPPRKH
ncbi:MAG: hypothetical protein M3167_02375 [Acidobacteriota bacterium]|nr:hypothetical protein [Acidobacteriota bacterium]